MKDWVRVLLPGVFAEVYHWKERAERAEARLGEVVAAFATTIAHEKEQHDARERELLAHLLAGNTSQKPPLPEDGEGRGQFAASSSFTQFTHPFQRKIQDFQQEQANSLPDDVVEAGVEEYLKIKAQGFDPFIH